MNLKKHNNFIYEYENAASHDLCDSIVSLIEPCIDNIITSSEASTKTQFVNNTAFNITALSYKYATLEKVQSTVDELISYTTEKYVYDNILLRKYVDTLKYINDFPRDLVYRFYDEGDSYDWHVDEAAEVHLTLSAIIYLNDDFEGGSTLFLSDRVKVDPKKGSILVFPCDFRTIHKGTKVRSGTKKIIWTCLEDYHKVQ